MSLANQSSLLGTVQQLKEIVSSREDGHELVRLVQQMELLAAEIERKSAPGGSVIVGLPVTPAVVV